MTRSFEVAVGWVPERLCGECVWLRDYCGRRVCYARGQVGRTVRGEEDATFCEDYEEAGP